MSLVHLVSKFGGSNNSWSGFLVSVQAKQFSCPARHLLGPGTCSWHLWVCHMVLLDAGPSLGCRVTLLSITVDSIGRFHSECCCLISTRGDPRVITGSLSFFLCFPWDKNWNPVVWALSPISSLGLWLFPQLLILARLPPLSSCLDLPFVKHHLGRSPPSLAFNPIILLRIISTYLLLHW